MTFDLLHFYIFMLDRYFLLHFKSGYVTTVTVVAVGSKRKLRSHSPITFVSNLWYIEGVSLLTRCLTVIWILIFNPVFILCMTKLLFLAGRRR